MYSYGIWEELFFINDEKIIKNEECEKWKKLAGEKKLVHHYTMVWRYIRTYRRTSFSFYKFEIDDDIAKIGAGSRYIAYEESRRTNRSLYYIRPLYYNPLY